MVLLLGHQKCIGPTLKVVWFFLGRVKTPLPTNTWASVWFCRHYGKPGVASLSVLPKFTVVFCFKVSWDYNHWDDCYCCGDKHWDESNCQPSMEECRANCPGCNPKSAMDSGVADRLNEQ
ncbi:hypothetical protein HU200_016699 [Digitaria exilis]|uniref:Uncharacterized protein n=1 Tax=Digitaria exilis TaxID=1010633 RepID=A0A835F798_9POAL|nr:hypothetical protein HU200_016699 [Digitaria exilis]